MCRLVTAQAAAMLCVQQQEEWRCAAMPEAEGGDGGDKAEHPTEGGYSVTVQRLCARALQRQRPGTAEGRWGGGRLGQSKSVETHERVGVGVTSLAMTLMAIASDQAPDKGLTTTRACSGQRRGDADADCAETGMPDTRRRVCWGV